MRECSRESTIAPKTCFPRSNADFLQASIMTGSRPTHAYPREGCLPGCHGPVRALTKLAKGLGSTLTYLTLAWVAKSPTTSTVILGVSSAAQLRENLGALEFLPKMTDAVMQQIEGVLGNKPTAENEFGRPHLAGCDARR
ncbi:hypothetical protein B0H15DRAFT_293209 [Mycena belliarum]|uniref:NADP-dependent oxidoreductase domain-containing protein n=1 Tax=Mycena belliarum TaxID=1033014 RepID=A0AAD6U7H5_9AGAR|nr:hypothetical protein B0H15DRAFT_293209 [Mycena belliae]